MNEENIFFIFHELINCDGDYYNETEIQCDIESGSCSENR